MNTKAFGLIALAIVGIATPAIAYTAAHPHTHMYWRSGINTYDVAAGGISAEGYSQLKGACFDVEPFNDANFQFVRDGDLDWGVGGACFEYETIYGSDAGKTVTIHVIENDRFSGPVLSDGGKLQGSASWVACIDVDGDGFCTEASPDTYTYCDSNGAGSGSHLTGASASTPCAVTLVPAADPTLYVLMLTTVTSSDAVIGGHGVVWING